MSAGRERQVVLDLRTGTDPAARLAQLHATCAPTRCAANA
jgi:hypothetical protein